METIFLHLEDGKPVSADILDITVVQDGSEIKIPSLFIDVNCSDLTESEKVIRESVIGLFKSCEEFGRGIKEELLDMGWYIASEDERVILFNKDSISINNLELWKVN